MTAHRLDSAGQLADHSSPPATTARRGPVTFSPALTIGLQAAVPLHILELRDWSPEHRAVVAAEMATTIGSHGDDLLFGGRRCAETFNAMARGLALLAYQPGGVHFAGEHWCTGPHAGCPSVPQPR